MSDGPSVCGACGYRHNPRAWCKANVCADCGMGQHAGPAHEQDCRVTAPVSGGDMRQQLAEVVDRHLTEQDYSTGCPLSCGYDGDDRATHIADALLPFVKRIADERAADVLTELGDYEDRMGSTLAAGRLYDRAAHLRAATSRQDGAQ